MATFNKFDSTMLAMASKVHNLGADTLKVMLTNIAPVRTNTKKADLTEIAAGNGYTAGGTQATLVSSTQAVGLYTLKLNNATFTATAGAIATFQYAVLYNDSATNKELLGWYDYGAAVNVTAGNSFTVTFDGTNGVLTLQ